MNINRRTFTKWLLGLFALPWMPKIVSGDYWPPPKPKDYDTSPVELSASGDWMRVTMGSGEPVKFYTNDSPASTFPNPHEWVEREDPFKFEVIEVVPNGRSYSMRIRAEA